MINQTEQTNTEVKNNVLKRELKREQKHHLKMLELLNKKNDYIRTLEEVIKHKKEFKLK